MDKGNHNFKAFHGKQGCLFTWTVKPGEEEKKILNLENMHCGLSACIDPAGVLVSCKT